MSETKIIDDVFGEIMSWQGLDPDFTAATSGSMPGQEDEVFGGDFFVDA